jgi:hypothetical protein
MAAVDVQQIPVEADAPAIPFAGDFLLDGSNAAIRAQVTRSADGQSISLHNGLIRRTWRLEPNGACVAFENLMTDRSMLRSVRPEARVTLNGVPYDVGGLVGQLNHAYLGAAEIDALTADPRALRLVAVHVDQPQERFGWMRRRHTAPDAEWPPKGIALSLEFAPPPWNAAQADALLGSAAGAADASVLGRDNQQPGFAPPSELGRELLWSDDFASIDASWQVHASATNPRSSFENEGKPGEIYTPAHTAVYAERNLPEGTAQVELTLDTGTDSSSSWGPGIALVFANRTLKFHIRPQGDAYDGKPMLGLWDGSQEHPRVAGQSPLDTAKPWTLRLRRLPDAVLCDARPDGGTWANYARVPLDANAGAPLAVRIGKLDPRGGGDDHPAAGPLVRCRMIRFAAHGAVDPERLEALSDELRTARQFRVRVHYELYDGIPAMCKWITVHNESDEPLVVNRFRSEELAAVEHANWVETREGVPQPPPEYLHVETDFAFGGFNFGNANRHAVHWRTDPLYTTQVNYLLQSPCLLTVEPTRGPAQTIAPGATFESFRTFELAYDEGDRERRGLALRRMYRTVAPWVTENPLTHHLLTNDPQQVRRAIDQAAEVGFEAIILSFGSGFNMENQDPEFLRAWRDVADYAASKQIELGCYALFSSRGVGADHMIVSPEGERPTHGQCPAVTSEWGLTWLKTIRKFYAETGFDQFENDGPYPGDVDVTARPPWQQGELDSRWVQWRLTAGLYRDLRAQGIFINAPDYYYLNGSNKCGMGYREVNWSLPRAHQVIHTRQNIFDGTWTKTPSMGWMFVPLAQYHGGGAAATVEPLDEHLDHYRQMMLSNLGLGVQAHYRGPRLFDTDRTRQMVRESVTWYRQYRDILESDLIHGRRADGQDVDWMLHANPQLEHRGMLCVYNPLAQDVTRTLRVDLYYTGLTDRAEVRAADSASQLVELDRRGQALVAVSVPAGEMGWYVIRAAETVSP